MQAQTFKIGPGAPTSNVSHGQAPAGQQLGFGSNIQNARLARAAELALQRGDHAQALVLAQRAAQTSPGDVHLWFLVGYAARLNGRLTLSAEAYKRGLQLSPSSVEGLSGLAQTYSVMGRTDDAEHLLTQIVTSYPGRSADALLLGNLYMRSGNYTEAINWLERAERMHPDARSEVLLAISYQHENRLDVANRYLQMARHRSPDNPDVQRTLAGFYRETGDYAAAISALQAIRHPSPDILAELAYTYQLQGNLEQSAAIYARAANAQPKNIDLQLSAAQSQVAAGQLKTADTFLHRAQGIDPNHYRLHAIRGEIAQLQERPQDAIQQYQAALQNLPASPAEGPLYRIQLHVDLLDLYRSLNQSDNAQTELATAQTEINGLQDVGPDRASFLRLRATIKMDAGQIDSALADIKEALSLHPHDPNSLQLNGDLLMKLGRTEDAIALYKQVLSLDARNRSALTSLGYASRQLGREADAEKYFQRLASDYPTLYIPYLALGDMYTEHNQFSKAQAAYKKAHALAPTNPLIIAGGMNASIEAHQLDRAAAWLALASDTMRQDPQMLKQQERYLRLHGDYVQSAAIGQQAIQALPQDRDVVVYLGYDLLQQGKYDELLQLTQKYQNAFPKDPDIPLLAGYVNKHNGDMEAARLDFTEALARDPNVITAYVNRGFVLNDLHQPAAAAADFQAAIERDPHDGEAHLGLAYSDLDLNHPQDAIHQSQLAEREVGDSEMIHNIRATAYGREGLLSHAISEYHAALRFDPQNAGLHQGLGNALFTARQYQQAVQELGIAAKLAPNDPNTYALLARAYANLGERDATLRNIQLAEQHAAQSPNTARNQPVSLKSSIYLSTGQALDTLGDQKAAMEHFREALAAAQQDRAGVRFAIASLMAQQGDSAGAERQIALAMMESEGGEAAPPTGAEYIQAADIFRELHEYQLSQTYLEHAKTAGAPDIDVRVGMANNYLAMGDTTRAAAELAAVDQKTHDTSSYQFLIAQANVYQQQHHGQQALTAFSQAATVGGSDADVQQDILTTAANEGYALNPTISLLGNFSVLPVYEASTVYVLDAKLDGPVPIPPSDIALLPTPRSSLDTQGTAAFHLHLNHLPTASGFFQVSNARGTISVPATSSIQRRSTTDYTLNFGLNPTVHVGSNLLTFDTGIQGTIRRDSESPIQLNQNLLREFAYVSSTSFFNAVSFSGNVVYESGPFTEINLHSSMLAGALDFRVGAPWSKTALVTGWGSNDQQFSPDHIEDYYTSSYIGLTHNFSKRWSAEALVEDLRTWRIFGANSGTAQAVRPAGTFDYSPTLHWNVHGSFAWSSTRQYHVYDKLDDGVSVSYVRPLHRFTNNETGQDTIQYPIRFSAGFQQQTFVNFSRGSNETLRPYFSITLF